MPYAFDEQNGVMRVTLEGRVSNTDLHALITDMNAMMAPRATWPDNLIDLRTVELNGPTFTDIMSLAKRREAAGPPNPIRTAMVTESAAMVGFARMFQYLMQNPSITIEVFATIEAAEDWLRRGRA